MEAILGFHIIAAAIKEPSILAVAGLLIVVAFRREIGDWIGRKFFGNQRR